MLLTRQLRQLFLPPAESPELAADVERSARAGLSALGVIAAIAPAAGPIAGAMAPGRPPWVHAAVAALGVATLIAARARALARWARLAGGAAAIAVVALLQVGVQRGLAPELPYVVLLAACALPLRPLHAAALCLAAGAAATAMGGTDAALISLALAPVLLLISAVLYAGRTRDLERRRHLDHRAENLARDAQRWRGLLDRLGEAVILVDDRTGLVEPLNGRLEELLGLPAGDARGSHFTRFLHPDDLERVIEHHLARVAGKPVPDRYRLRLVHADGHAVVCELTGRRSPDHSATVVALREVDGSFAAVG